MATYSYKARDAQGQTKKGRLEAADLSQARITLKNKSLIVLTLKEYKELKLLSFGKTPKLSLRQKIIITEQLGVMIKSGLSVSAALKAIVSDVFKPAINQMLNDIAADVEGGSALSTSLIKYPRSFDHVFIQMIKAGERSGKLDEIMGRISNQLQKDYEIKSKVKSALIYPAIIVSLMLAVVVVIVVYVIPRLKTVFDDAKVELPLSTRALLSISDFFVSSWLWILIGLVVIFIGLKILFLNQKVALLWDKIKMRLPVYGPIVRRVYMARFSLGFASLLSSGLPILEIFETTSDLTGNLALKNELEQMKKQVENGLPMSTALKESKYFPNLMAQLTSVGEKSGTLADTFWVIADFYQKEVDTVTKNISSALEPLIMIVLGIGIALLLISVLQPMYNLVNAI